MPYLEYVFCERCGDYANLDIDASATIEAYSKEGRENVAIVQQTMVWDYLIYSCGICGSKYKYTYQNIEEKVRKYFSSLSEEYKEYFDEVIAKAAAEGKKADMFAPNKSAPAAAETMTSGAKDRIRDLYTAKK